MEEELVKEFAAEVEITPSVKGAYEVEVDGKRLFSKLELKRFPRDGEIVRLIQQDF